MVDVAVFPSGQWNRNEVSARRLVRPGGTIGALPSKARLRRHDDYRVGPYTHAHTQSKGGPRSVTCGRCAVLHGRTQEALQQAKEAPEL